MIALAGGALLLLYLYRPQGQFFFPRCSFHTLTGLLCPGCGGLRAAHALLHGEILEALRSNALAVLSPIAAVIAWFHLRRRSPGFNITTREVWIIFAVLMLFTILRNLPWAPFHWLGPA